MSKSQHGECIFRLVVNHKFNLTLFQNVTSPQMKFFCFICAGDKQPPTNVHFAPASVSFRS